MEGEITDTGELEKLLVESREIFQAMVNCDISKINPKRRIAYTFIKLDDTVEVRNQTLQEFLSYIKEESRLIPQHAGNYQTFFRQLRGIFEINDCDLILKQNKKGKWVVKIVDLLN